jgi:prepilin-type N-terminal cleavage/methylation domain-containing protein
MRHGFSLLEVLLALIIAALVMAAVGPALVSALRTQRRLDAILDPLVSERGALRLLGDDLLAAPTPTGTVAEPFLLSAVALDGSTGSQLSFLTCGAPPIHPSLAVRSPDLGQALVTWAVATASDGSGLQLTRSRQSNLLATGTRPDPTVEVILDHLASCVIEAYSSGVWTTAYDSSSLNAALPTAVRITWSQRLAEGKAGDSRIMVFELPLAELGGS